MLNEMFVTKSYVKGKKMKSPESKSKMYKTPAQAKRAGSVNAKGGTKGMGKAQTDIARVKALKAEITRLKAMVNAMPSVPASAKRAGSVNGRGGTKGMAVANKAVSKARMDKFRKSERTTKSAGTRRYGSM